MIDADGRISDIIITNHGEGYNTASVTIEDEEGEGASANVTISDGSIFFVEADPDTDYLDPGATAFDRLDGIIDVVSIDSSAVDLVIPGTYMVSFSAKDSTGNVNDTTRRTVVVRDSKAPDLRLRGSGPPTGI